jgi:hypothetical protein
VSVLKSGLKGLKDRAQATLPPIVLKGAAGIRKNARYAFHLLKTLNVNPPYDPVVEIRMDPDIQGLAPFLVGTQTGLVLIREGRAVRLLGGSVYGIAPEPVGKAWCVFQRIPESFGRLIRYDIQSGQIHQMAGFLSTGVHQIDFVRGRLAVMDTYNNRIVFYNTKGRILGRVWPEGRLDDGRASINYKHFNSIFSSGQSIFIIAHNQSAKTGKSSDIYELDTAWNTVGKISTESGSAHNIVLMDEKLWHCDSNGGTLVVDREPVFEEAGLFTRGLAVNEEHILIGGSTLAEREDRASTDGHIIVLNRRFNKESRIVLKGSGGVHELRFLEHDLGLSSNHVPK